TFIGALMKVTLFLDKIFFPGAAKQKIEKPVFLIGHLRSGTTFLHRFLTENCGELRGFAMWEMVFPALSMRKIIRPFLPLVKNLSFDGVWDPKIHKTDLFSMETDDIALSMRYFDGILSWIYFYCWQEFDESDMFEKELVEVAGQEKFAEYLQDIHRKNIWKTDRRMFSKSFAQLFAVDKIEEIYENPRIMLIIRNPLEAVPSMMSLEKRVQESLNNYSSQPVELQQRFLKNMYRTSLFYYKMFDEIAEKKKNSPNFLLLTHKQLMTDFDNTFERIISFCDLKKDEKFAAALKTQSEKQKTFKTEHVYSLEQFGLTEEQVRKDFAFVFEKYDLD
ncbi:sulfotransferase, partial [bacterium]|nr:sulfotransferase [bacterium]